MFIINFQGSVIFFADYLLIQLITPLFFYFQLFRNRKMKIKLLFHSTFFHIPFVNILIIFKSLTIFSSFILEMDVYKFFLVIFNSLSCVVFELNNLYSSEQFVTN